MPKTPEYTEGPEALANFKQFATAILQAPSKPEQTGDRRDVPRLFFSNSLRQAGVNAQTLGGLAESLISSPQKRGRIDEDRRYQLCIGQTDAEAVQTASLDHSPHFAQLRHLDLG
jgi:hypothetical protein